MELQSLKQRFGIIGNSQGINYALEIAQRVSATNLTVLITGESGVGKEIFSQIIHQYSKRKHNAFIAVNCGAIPEGTIDSELFGHEKGAFTGASDNRKGYFETVNGGTIFLDEIGEMPLGTQARLLRVLESGEFIKVGSSKVIKTDVRVVAATNVALSDLINRGKFREDLYYRLNTVPITVPPLRDRQEDIYLLFRKFAQDFAEQYRMPAVVLENEARVVLETYPWPGNIRELKNISEQVSVLAKDKVVTEEALRSFLPDISKRNLPVAYTGENGKSSESFSERELLYKVLFEMRKDLNDLKKFVWQLSGGNNETGQSDAGGITLPSNLIPSANVEPRLDDHFVSNRDGNSAGQEGFNQFQERLTDRFSESQDSTQGAGGNAIGGNPLNTDSNKPVVIDSGETIDAHAIDSVEESLSIEEMEKDLILRALKKHKGKRKDAALDLGISERTLYRKIKEYEIVE
ncbi:MAG: transcriptional regulator with PAS, ATPase and Fis domain [Limisphaerales bacterium]|jgi:transcriptional regulator with PAS, ATPase and Fis domain